MNRLGEVKDVYSMNKDAWALQNKTVQAPEPSHPSSFDPSNHSTASEQRYNGAAFFHERKGKEGERGDKDKNKKGKRRPHVFIMEEMQLGYPRAEFELLSSPELRVKRARFVYSVVPLTKRISDQVPSGNGPPEGSVGIRNLSVHARSRLKQTLLLYSTMAEKREKNGGHFIV